MKALILYGTLTMNTETVAAAIYEAVEGSGQFEQVDIVNMVEIITAAELEAYDYLIIGTSTWSEGDYPPDTEEFMQKITEFPPQIEGKKVSFFGLGETSYEHFCDSIFRLKKIFKDELKIKEVGELHTIDGYPDDQILDSAKNWILATIKTLA